MTGVVVPDPPPPPGETAPPAELTLKLEVPEIEFLLLAVTELGLLSLATPPPVVKIAADVEEEVEEISREGIGEFGETKEEEEEGFKSRTVEDEGNESRRLE
jgi:hypothetical protein